MNRSTSERRHLIRALVNVVIAGVYRGRRLTERHRVQHRLDFAVDNLWRGRVCVGWSKQRCPEYFDPFPGRVLTIMMLMAAVAMASVNPG